MYKDVEFEDVYMGVMKSLFFGLLLIWISASKGYYVHLQRGGGFGAEGVSSATTNAVVLASVTILVFDFFLTSVLL